VKIIVISDAHGRAERITKVVNKHLDSDYLFYLGDQVADLQDAKPDFNTDLNIVYVKGNCDFSKEDPEEGTVIVRGKKVFLTHGHRYSVKWSKNKLYYRSQEIGADIILFGHTHVRYVKREAEQLFFNPGSIALPRDNKPPSYGIIEIKDNEITYKHKRI